MAVSDVGDRKSYQSDSTESFQYQGYCLTAGDEGDNNVKKTPSADPEVPFLGVNFISTLDEEDETVRAGEPVSVEQDGWVNVLCEEGSVYNVGDPVYLSANRDGVATLDSDPAGDGSVSPTRVGTVARHRDLTGETEEMWVVCSITGYV